MFEGGAKLFLSNFLFNIRQLVFDNWIYCWWKLWWLQWWWQQEERVFPLHWSDHNLLNSGLWTDWAFELACPSFLMIIILLTITWQRWWWKSFTDGHGDGDKGWWLKTKWAISSRGEDVQGNVHPGIKSTAADSRQLTTAVTSCCISILSWWWWWWWSKWQRWVNVKY